MAEYHVGCGLSGIYAGTLNKKGNMWVNKSPVTEEALDAVAQYLIMTDQSMWFNYNNKSYVLKVEEVKDND